MLVAGEGGLQVAFQRDLASRSLTDHVLLMAWSEFGRRAAENASAGTDHGKGGSVMLVGTGVEPGIHGTRPDLSSGKDREKRPGNLGRAVIAVAIDHDALIAEG